MNMFDETPRLSKDMERVFVVVQLENGHRYRGHVFVGRDERLQDLLNDERAFIPIEMKSPHSGSVILGKRFIVSIEEVEEHGQQAHPLHREIQGRAKEGARRS